MVNYNGLYNKEFFGETLNQNHFHNKKLHFKIIENGTILPHKAIGGTDGFGGLVDAQGNFIKRSSLHNGIGDAYTPTAEVKNNFGTVVYLGMLVTAWGHCLTDGLKRLWFLKSDTYKHYFRNCPVVFTPMWWTGGGLLKISGNCWKF